MKTKCNYSKEKPDYRTGTLLLFISSLLFLWITACSDDEGYVDVDGLDPNLELSTVHVKSAAGKTFNIVGAITDKDGITEIRLECADLDLNKTINLIEIYEKPLETYALDYKFSLQKNESREQFTIKITVVDVGGRTVSKDLLVTMDGDFEAPLFTLSPDKNITVLMKTETKLNFRFSVSDDRALDYVLIEIPGIIGFSSRKLDAGGEKTFTFAETIALPNEVRNYDVTIKAVDKTGKQTEAKSVIAVSEMPDFEKMYLADVATTEELNSDVFGVPMRIERTDAYTYKANYYNREAGTEIFFLPQKSDFSPICFGLNPEDKTKLTDDPETAKPIVLEKANTYYEITFNTKDGDFQVKTYSVKEAINPIPHKYGSKSLDTWGDGGSLLQDFYFGYMTSGPADVKRFTQDEANPNLFYLEEPLALEAGTKMNFVVHNWHPEGWWNYCTWRVDNSEEPEIFGYYGKEAKYKNPAWTKPDHVGDNWAKPTVNVTGKYQLIFDAHLERAKLVPAK